MPVVAGICVCIYFPLLLLSEIVYKTKYHQDSSVVLPGSR